MQFGQPGGGAWPTPIEDVLIGAAIGRLPAKSAWSEFAQHTRHPVNEGVTRLYPLVASRLAASDLKSPEFAELAAARRSALTNHLRVVHFAQIFLDRFAERNIDMLLLKGLALSVAVFKDGALRPMADIDVLVREEHLEQAQAIVLGAGFRPILAPALTPTSLRYRPYGYTGHTYRSAQGVEIDVHTHVRPELLHDDDYGDIVWSTSRRIEWEGRSWRVPSSTCLLIDTILHGAKWNGVNSIRWVTDAYFILTKDRPVDWELLLKVVRQTRLTVVFRHALHYLAKLGADIPPGILNALDAAPASWLERVEYRVRMRPMGFIGDVFPFRPMVYWLRARGTRWEKLRALFYFFVAVEMGMTGAGQMGDFARRRLGRRFHLRRQYAGLQKDAGDKTS